MEWGQPNDGNNGRCKCKAPLKMRPSDSPLSANSPGTSAQGPGADDEVPLPAGRRRGHGPIPLDPPERPLLAHDQLASPKRRGLAPLLISRPVVLLPLFLLPLGLFLLGPSSSPPPHARKELQRPRAAYSEVRASSTESGAQVWVLNAHELGRRHRRTGPRDALLFGLARVCGPSCTVRLRHGGQAGTTLRIRLERRGEEAGRDSQFNRSAAASRLLPHLHLPIVQSMDSESDSLFRLSRISPWCFYSARVDLSPESSVVNLCDRNGGLFGTLALASGAFLIEPLVDAEEGGEGKSARRKRHLPGATSDLRAHLIYRLQTHHFADDLQRGGNGSMSGEEKAAGGAESGRGWNGTGDEQGPGLGPQGRTVPVLLDRRIGRRSADSWEHFVEVLVVADYKMLLYHQQNLESYVLTLFSTVSSIYRHPSLSASINVVVVRLMVLKNERAGPTVSNRAQETLQNFCQWQQLYNDRNDDVMNHHDVAILLTRHDICRATNKCDTLGLAELGTMCDGRKSCAIIEDNGLSAAFTIAHELGHIFNIPHDDERKCAEFMPLNKNNYHIMAPTLEYNTNPWSWSPCSAAMLLRFLDHRRAQTQCLLDQPVERRYYDKMFETPAPGAIYSVGQQCKFVFGAAAEICPYMPTCRRLWCSVSYGYQMGCRTQHMPWADGTPCGQSHWCHRGQCVGLSPSQRQPVDGGWGEWRPWRECSRTCGGGVQKALRDCDSPRPENGGKFCVGQRERYRPCSIQDCPLDMPGFRELQCSEFDGKDIGIHGVPRDIKWVPKYAGVAENERCRLFCRAADSAAFYLLKDKVVDGTPCDRHGDDICIDGTCHKAGCDHRLGSDVKRDVCGVCGGDGSTCREVKGAYNERGTFGYNEVIRIPAGAAGIDITQTAYNGQKEDDNYLALKLGNGEFLLNGQYQVSVFRQQIPVLDTVFEYSGSDQPVERINGTGPLREDVYLHVLSVGNLNPPNIHYHFMNPIATPFTQTSTFYWRKGNTWSECSLQCQGTQRLEMLCVNAFENRVVAEAHCAESGAGDVQERMCNVDCFYKHQQRLGADSAGRKWHQYICVRSYTNGREEQAAETECRAAGVVPPTMQAQPAAQKEGHKQVPSDRRWAYSQWSQCSESCGAAGLSRRSLHCMDTRNGHKLDARFCEGIPHEPVETECNRTPCPRWAYGQWSECSRSCGGGIRLRHASCQDAAGREVGVRMCAGAKADSEKCNEHKCTKWLFGPWTPCSVSCGQGLERREARCVDSDGRPVDDSACEQRERIMEKQCHRAACPHWQLGSWSQCSVSCGQDGFQTRLVQCVDGAGRRLADQRCSTPPGEESRPQSHKVCSPGPCPYWRMGDWSECSVSCGQGMREREVECVLKDQPVDDSLCAGAQRPPSQDRCVLVACAVWSTEPWGECSASCGWGVQRRTVSCERQTGVGLHANRSIIVHEKECSGQRPRTEKSCEQEVCATTTLVPAGVKWSAGPWSECPQSCGQDALQRRQVECRDAHRELPTAYCAHLERPEQSRPCSSPPECAPRWAAADWEPCSASCAEKGTVVQQRRRVRCERPNGTEAEDARECAAGQRPEERRPCSGLPLCAAEREPHREKSYGTWEKGDWSPCSASCGGGWRRRSLFCNNSNGNPLACRESEKPAQFEQCGTQECGIGNWHIGTWSHCSASCGEGTQRREIWCNSVVDVLQRLPDGECPPEGKPLAERSCARAECPQRTPQTAATTSPSGPIREQSTRQRDEQRHQRGVFRWESGPWSSCPRQCGNPVRTRWVRCLEQGGSQPQAADEHRCALEERPPSEHRCKQTHCPRWHKGKWGTCSASCGTGVARREVTCRRGRGGRPNGTEAEDARECAAGGPKPSETRGCELRRCPQYRWRVGPWSKCDSCKPGEQRRRVFCTSDLGKRAADRMCEGNGTAARPAENRKCPADGCPYHWVAGPWSTCSRTCGAGFHFRRIECKVRREVRNPHSAGNSSLSAHSEPTVLSRMCMGLEKPIVTKQCELNPRCDVQFVWSVGPWSQCSKNCGPGFRRRKVRCLDRTGQRSLRERCDETNRPRRREPCFLRNCLPSDCAELREQNTQTGMLDGNYTVLVAGFRVLVYCHRMNETVPKTYLNVPAESNFAEFYGKRLSYPYSCPHDGRRNDSCACTNDGHVQTGLTRFSRVRVDLQNMKINPHDYTFAETEHGIAVAYGTAGDCYSMSECPQGRFSIDLRGTGLRLVEDLQWVDQGHRTSSRIDRSKNNALVQGFCGGYCGECAPDRFKGLVVEVDRRQKPSVGVG